MRRSQTLSIPAGNVMLLAASIVLLLAGCAKQEEISTRQDQPINAQTENLGTSIKIIRKDPFPWHNVTFQINKFYEYRVDLVDQPEIEIPYDSFVNVSGEPYDVTNENPYRFHIYADEGRWPHRGAHN
jgi:hypothetical protein